jgi:hypothetical protein
MTRRPILIGCLAVLSGCTDAPHRFEEFLERIPDATPEVRVDAAKLDKLPDVTGTFYVGLATTPAPDLPLRFFFRNQMSMNHDGTASMNLTITPLSVAEGKPVGEDMVVKDVRVNASGEFSFLLDPVKVAGAANPISGSDIEGAITMSGQILSADRYCGWIPEGRVVKPVELDAKDSKWGGVRVAEGTVGDALPPLESECPKPMASDAGVPDAGAVDAGTTDAASATDAQASDGGAL